MKTAWTVSALRKEFVKDARPLDATAGTAIGKLLRPFELGANTDMNYISCMVFKFI